MGGGDGTVYFYQTTITITITITTMAYGANAQ
jgi:hypothetical protein